MLYWNFIMPKLYSVVLQDAQDLPMRGRIEAEIRFASELEDVLGGPEYVAETYQAWIEVSGSEANRVDRHTALNAARWPVALNAATQAGLGRLGEVGHAHFEVRLERARAAT
jgi:hypothetical protein